LSLVDLSREPHPAPHPRQGAIDMVAFMPLSELRCELIARELASCDDLAWNLGQKLGMRGVPVLMYGLRAQRSLLETRRGTSFFSSVTTASSRDTSTVLPLDFGPGPPLRQDTGISIIGSMPYVTNFNVRVAGEISLVECRSIASRVRTDCGVQVMALPYSEGTFEIGCNLQATENTESPSTSSVLLIVQSRLPPNARVVKSYVVGLTPAEALRRAQDDQATGQYL